MNPTPASSSLDPLYSDPPTHRTPEDVRLALAAFDASLNSIISMSAIRNANGQIIDFMIQTANAAVEQSFLVTPDQIIGKPLLEVFPVNTASGLFDFYVQVVETDQPDRTVQYYIDEYGIETWFEVSAARHEGDKVVVTFLNVTQSKKAELAIKRQADLFQTVMDHAQVAISFHMAIRNTDNRIVDFRTVLANQQANAMWGDFAKLINARTFLEVAIPAQQNEDFPKYVRVVETGEPDLSEFNINDKWWLRMTAKSGDGVVISSIDITENRRYRQQLESANIELRRSNENLQTFVYIASHDLQEPVRKIQAFGDILSQQYASMLDAEGAEIIGRMQTAAGRMSLLIRDLLNYSRIASQRDNFRSFSLAKLLDDIVEDLWHPIEQTNAQLEFGDSNGETLPNLNGDRLQLRQLFQNLLSNALKFHRTDVCGTPIPPVIRVTAHFIRGADLPKDLQQELSVNSSYWAVQVADNGIGFEQKHADLVFQVFQQLHGRQQFEGTGIGLAVVKKVVEQHDGAIRVASEPAVGTTFTVYLPA